MWRKTTGAKPSMQPPDTPAPAPVTTTSAREVAQADLQSPSTTSPTADSVPAERPVSPPTRAADSTIVPGLSIRGDVSGSSDLVIHGEVRGKISLLKSRVTIGPSGRVHADIEAREIFIDGTIHGNLKATEGVHLGSSGKFKGSVLTPKFGVDDGARIHAKVEMTRADDPRPASDVSLAESERLRPVSAGARGR